MNVESDIVQSFSEWKPQYVVEMQVDISLGVPFGQFMP